MPEIEPWTPDYPFRIAWPKHEVQTSIRDDTSAVLIGPFHHQRSLTSPLHRQSAVSHHPRMASRLVLITGANSGVGLATTKVLASASASYHILMAGRTLSKVDSAADSLRQQMPHLKASISTLQLDVTSDSSISAAAKRVQAEHGRLDVLINNAGIYLDLAEGMSTREKYEKTFATNVVGPALVTEAFEPLLVKSADPYLLYISSSLGSLSRASDTTSAEYVVEARAYRASKSALDMLAVQDQKILGRGYGDGTAKGKVKAFAVCPGLEESNLRGTAEIQRKAGGRAGDPEESGRTVLGILEGQRDGDVGRFVHKDGVYGW